MESKIERKRKKEKKKEEIEKNHKIKRKRAGGVGCGWFRCWSRSLQWQRRPPKPAPVGPFFFFFFLLFSLSYLLLFIPFFLFLSFILFILLLLFLQLLLLPLSSRLFPVRWLVISQPINGSSSTAIGKKEKRPAEGSCMGDGKRIGSHRSLPRNHRNPLKSGNRLGPSTLTPFFFFFSFLFFFVSNSFTFNNLKILIIFDMLVLLKAQFPFF